MAKRAKDSVRSMALSRDTSQAGQTVKVGGKSVTYDNKGYAVEAGNDKGAKAARYSADTGGGYSGGTGISVSGGSGYTGGTYAGGQAAQSVQPSVDYHKQAMDAAARGDWGAVSSALAARQTKINAQGGNDRGTSNAQILNELKSRYNASYGLTSQGTKDKLALSAGGRLPFATDYAGGTVYKNGGYDTGTDYLLAARQMASAGDLDGAREALLRRGFKMADTGSSGGVTQDQAYAEINRLYSQSPAARSSYENELAINRQRLAEHQTRFGSDANPALAYKQIKSVDNKHWIIHDGQGKPVAARPVSTELGTSSPKYGQTEIDLMSRYYGGTEDFAQVRRQLHNEAVARTGVGRLYDREGNYASGTAVSPVRAEDWTGTYTGGSVSAPTVQVQQGRAWEDVPQTGSSSEKGNLMGGYRASETFAVGSDLSAYLQQMYGAQLNAQLAQLRAAYDQQVAQSRANDEKIRQAYYQQQNAAAAQNELQRLSMGEMGAASGLNTGASGQLALALGASLQDSLAALGAAREQDLSANDLQRLQMLAEYNGSVNSAQAQSGAALMSALYDEAVRRENQRYQAWQAALAQQNWERQFQYQQDQDALTAQSTAAGAAYDQQSAAQKNAYSLASTMLKSGIMPADSTLELAGIPRADAAALAAAYSAAKTGSGSGRNSDTGSRGQDYSGLYNEYQGWAKDSGALEHILQGVNMQLSNGNLDRAENYVATYWDRLSGREQAVLQNVLAKYGIQYEAKQ